MAGGIDLFQADGTHVTKMESEHAGSVTSLHAFHPDPMRANVLAAANASGRIFLWR